jgi:protein ImuB
MTAGPSERPGRPGRVACVACVPWPLVAVADPTRPAAVLERGRVVAATAAARAAGVRVGRGRREAEAACCDLEVVARDPAAEARTFEPVLAAVADLAPRLVADRPGRLYLPARGPARALGGEAATAGRLREAAAGALPARPGLREEVRVRVGIADGVFTATLAARRDAVVPPGGAAAFLAPLPVESLGDPELAGLLRRLGLTTLGAFAALEPAAVRERFGPPGLDAHRRARGDDPTPLVPDPPIEDLTAVLDLDPPPERLETVAFAARRLAAGFCDRLRAHGRSCLQVTVVAETATGERCERTWRHDPPEAAALADRIRWQLDGWLGGTAGPPPRSGLVRLRLVPEALGPPLVSRPGLWGGDGGRAARATRVIARLQGWFGAEAAARLVRRGGRDPAGQVLRVPWGAPDPPLRPHAPVRGPVAVERPAWPGRLPGPAPARVFDPPLPAVLLDASGRPVRVGGRGEASAPPAVLRCPPRPALGGRVRDWAGPWPLEERWWDRRARRRLARWRLGVEGPEGPLSCLVRTVGATAAVEGLYD